MARQKPNEYQRVVAIVHRLFSPVGARVILGADIVVREDEGPRDVDVLVEYGPELLPTRVAIEAKDWGRPVGIAVIEEYRTKYDPELGIKVDKVIVVGKSFSKPAISLANRLGFDLHTLYTLETISPSDFSRAEDSDLRLWLGPEKTITLYLRRTDGGWLKGNLATGNLISQKSRRKYGSPGSLAEKVLNAHLGKDVSQYYIDNEGKRLHLCVELSLPNMLYRRKGYRDEPVRTLFFDFGTHMIFPDFTVSQEVIYESPQGISKKLKRVKPADKSSNISITYEDPLKAIHLDGVDEGEKIVTFKLDFDIEIAHLESASNRRL